MPFLTTHTFRHLRLTHLARAGLKLHEIATYAGHRDLRTTQIYIHLSGTDLAARMAMTVAAALQSFRQDTEGHVNVFNVVFTA